MLLNSRGKKTEDSEWFDLDNRETPWILFWGGKGILGVGVYGNLIQPEKQGKEKNR